MSIAILKLVVKTFPNIRFQIGDLDEDLIAPTDDVEYWATTPHGGVLRGLNRDGLDKILAALGALEEDILQQLNADLEAMAVFFVGLLEKPYLELLFEGDGFLFRVAGINRGKPREFDFSNVEAFVSMDHDLPVLDSDYET
ncbi:hypothetical protein [Rhizobium leguminosarum]|uniref:hypothetical protein n=1 Tax=Rhizobium leguminosarum TaxID=384 RepID=UPI001F3058F2|nr:hypothetical protein [Rhizobium leguminosarum]UIK19381.1 hypothetical protein LZK79_10340 [Rhizobium leguminosarum]